MSGVEVALLFNGEEHDVINISMSGCLISRGACSLGEQARVVVGLPFPFGVCPVETKASVVRVSNGCAAIEFDSFDACEQKILFEYLCRVGVEKRFSIM